MTCKSCIHFDACSDHKRTTRYYGRIVACDDVEERCKLFRNKADVVEVRHSEWIDNEDDFWVICSNCCIEILDNEMDIIDNYKYCPYCGAKMDGKGD